MKTAFGPWTTAMHAGSKVELSAFWKRRMTKLVAVSRAHSSPTGTARGLVAVVLLVLVLPTLRVVPAVSKEQEPRGRSEQAADSSKLEPALNQPQAEFRDDDQTVLRRLAERWRRQRPEVRTARINYLSLTTGSNFAPVRQPLVEATFEGVDLLTDPQEAFRSKIAPVIFLQQHGLDHLWLRERTFSMDGERTRSDSDYGMIFVSNGSYDIVRQSHPNHHQIDIHARGESHWRFKTIEDFRYLPHPDIPYVVERRTADQIYLQLPRRTPRPESGRTHAVIDPKSGLAEAIYFHDSNGTVVRHILQSEFVTDQHGITYPRVVLKLRYNRQTGLLSGFDLSIIKLAEFNIELPEETFRVPVAAGDVVVDYRKKTHARDPHAFKVKDPSDDVTGALSVE
jgi:hypothetical protein